MIKLTDLISEEYGGGEYSIPSNHVAFMHSPDGFSCANCKYYYHEDNKHKCGNDYFQKWNGSEIMKIEDPTKWCSDWFEPKK